jgi:hypothetical protein
VTRRRCYPLSSSRRAPVGLEQLRRLPPVIETGPAPASEIRGRTRQALRSCEGCSGQWPTATVFIRCPSVARQRTAVVDRCGRSSRSGDAQFRNGSHVRLPAVAARPGTLAGDSRSPLLHHARGHDPRESSPSVLLVQSTEEAFPPGCHVVPAPTAIMARHRAHRSSNGIFIAICRASATASES